MSVPETFFPHKHLFVGVGMDLERCYRIQYVHPPLRRAGILGLGKRIRILFLERIHHVLLAIDIDRMMLKKIKCTDVVQSAGMVLMIVCLQNGIKVSYIAANHLISEVRTGIHKYCKSAIFDKSGRPQTLVSWICRFAHRAVTSYHRHAL